ncbi:MAG: hypothetical protein M3T49_10400, partial [Candidatus Eremiobacteraeota bacterium]|nr:hypothetical protein [Candidatus Eremiobacteraeota bacterium]
MPSGSVSNGSTTPAAAQRTEAEETTRLYSLQRRTLHIANMLASLAALGVFASSKACARLGHGFRRRMKRPSGATAAGLLMTAGVSAAASLPFEYASGYVLERKYGLSNQNAKQWWGEYAKGSAIGLGLMLLFGSAFYALTRRSPRRW